MNLTPLLLNSNMPLGTIELLIILVLIGFIALAGVIPFWFICKKAGLSPWLSLIFILPFGVFVLPLMLATMEWPALKQSQSPVQPPPVQ